MIYYVLPLGEVWLVRRIGSRAEAYPTKDDAVAAAWKMASAAGGRVRVLTRHGVPERAAS